METDSRTILISAGEASGDSAAAAAIRAVRKARPHWRVMAIGGPLMEAAGAEILLDYREISVMGFSEIFTRLPRLRRELGRFRRLLSSGEVDLFIPVDFPGFNLRLSQSAKKRGLPVLYFIAPQVWAWGGGRVSKMARDIDCLAAILPFEEAWFRARGIDCRYVGHPLLGRFDDECAQGEAGLALLPGSRAQEVRRLLPEMLSAARQIAETRPDLEVYLLESPALEASFYDDFDLGIVRRLHRRRGKMSTFLHGKQAAMVASGTATLETALAGVPMVVAYRGSLLTYLIAKTLVSIDRIALVNLVLGDGLVPELIQKQANGHNLAQAVAPLLEDGETRQRQISAFGKLTGLMGKINCGEKVADIALELLEGQT